ncbi:MAG TPA: GNAT family N-acetyltransferase [Candidatus Peribacteraceae bacterium]|nr:GNAT family N-acetyltransferase [Candidatus Peribacteraceae bacterium]
MNDVIVRKAAKDELLALRDLDFTWETAGRFDLHYDGTNIHLSESTLPTPVQRGSNDHYHREIEHYADLSEQPDALMLVAYVDDNPVGYVTSFVEEWKDGMVINVDGILVGREFRSRGIAKALITDLIERAKHLDKCRGIAVEMDTEKYEANKLLLSMRFTFAGTRFYIYSNEDPKPGSKEALYFYYKVG